jgi:hypothetical protein
MTRLTMIATALLGCLMLSSCGTLRQLPPAHLESSTSFVVFTDGFHSGVALPRSVLPPELDPPTAGASQQWPVRTFHFGEEKWTSGADNSMSHAIGLVFIPGPGVVQSDHTPKDLSEVPALDQQRLRTWRFRVSDAGLQRMLARLRERWMDGIMIPPPPDSASTLFPSPRSWSVFDSCHDFTVDLLRAAGLELRGRWLYLAGGLTTDLDDAQADLDAAGIEVIGPTP